MQIDNLSVFKPSTFVLSHRRRHVAESSFHHPHNNNNNNKRTTDHISVVNKSHTKATERKLNRKTPVLF